MPTDGKSAMATLFLVVFMMLTQNTILDMMFVLLFTRKEEEEDLCHRVYQ